MNPADTSLLRSAFQQGTAAHLAIDLQANRLADAAEFAAMFGEGSISISIRRAYSRASELAGLLRETGLAPNLWTASTPIFEGEPVSDLVFRNPDERAFLKTIDDAFSVAALSTELERNGTRVLLVTGVDAHACVRATVEAALERQHIVVPVVDAINFGFDPASGMTETDYLKARAREKYGEAILPVTTDEIRALVPGP